MVAAIQVKKNIQGSDLAPNLSKELTVWKTQSFSQ